MAHCLPFKEGERDGHRKRNRWTESGKERRTEREREKYNSLNYMSSDDWKKKKSKVGGGKKF